MNFPNINKKMEQLFSHWTGPLRLAKSLEEIVRSEKCIPATICLLDSKICVGLNENQLSLIAQKNSGAVKASVRDIPNILAQVG